MVDELRAAWVLYPILSKINAMSYRHIGVRSIFLQKPSAKRPWIYVFMEVLNSVIDSVTHRNRNIKFIKTGFCCWY